MDKKSVEEVESRFSELVQQPPYPVDEMIELIKGVPEGKGAEMALALLKALSDAADFEGAFRLVFACHPLLSVAKVPGVAVRDALRKTTKDRLLLSFVDSVGFDTRALREAVGRLERLLSFHKGVLVLSSAWGLGEVRALDYFYRRVTVDFRLRHGHQFTYDAACEMLQLAPESHILVTQRADPARIEKMLKDEPGEFVKEMLRSFGDMSVSRLEEVCAQFGFVKAGDPWKKFWSRARTELGRDKLVDIPTRRADPIHIKAAAEDYGVQWFTALAQMREPKGILSSVREFEGSGRYRNLDAEGRTKIAERLAFALKGVKFVDDALYARIAFCIADLKLDEILAANEKLEHALPAKARAYLWDLNLDGGARYLAAARELPAREVGGLVDFLTAENPDETKKSLFAVLPQMCFPLLSATLDKFRMDADCEAAVAALLKSPSAPATLVTLVLGRYDDFKHWTKLPPLVVILTHAIALGEGKQGGETLRMQNMIRRLFADQKWLKGVFDQLGPDEKALFFERFQASIAWDPSTHHMIVVRMTKIAPELANRQVRKAEVKKTERITSFRSFAERQAAYEHLVNVDIPTNTKRIEFARSYGDLSENAEYQYAKDEQRALLQKQTVMQEELNVVKAVDFSDVVSPEEVCPGSTVSISVADGERVFTVLGEWDNDLERGVISNRTKLAQNMLGKKVGDTFDLPDAEGNVAVATIKAVSALSDELRAWVKEAPAAV